MKKSAIDIWVGLFVTIGMLAMLFFGTQGRQYERRLIRSNLHGFSPL